MADKGIVEFYYTTTLPANSVAIAKVSGSVFTPSDLVSINNLNVLDQGQLGVWKSATPLTSVPDFKAPDLNQSIAISGDSSYYVGNQFFEVTNILSANKVPMYYQHQLPAGVTVASILDANNKLLSVEMSIVDNTIYHSQPDGYYRVRYVDTNGFIQIEMLLFTPVLSRSYYTTSIALYTYTAKLLSTFTTGTYYIRFTAANGYQVLAPYNTLSNVPWFVRIRSGINPTPPEMSTQPFVPVRPYLLGTWISGAVINSSTIQFERLGIYYNSSHLPDILVFDANNKIKYALDGTSVNVKSTKGYQYNWKQGLVNQVDDYKARVVVGVDLDPTDLVFGFYSYEETDVIFTDLDVNPFTNPAMKNGQVTFYLKTNGIDPTKYLYYTLADETGTVIQTNDKSPATGTNQVFSQIVVGASVTISELTVTDIRQRGGGLSPAFETIPESANFWDLGYWDGKPYPVAGAMIVYLPQTVLNTMSQGDVQSKLESILPLGTLPVVRYYDDLGNEY